MGEKKIRFFVKDFLMFLCIPHNLHSILKEGNEHLRGLEETTVRNIQACKAFSSFIRTSLGPNGMNKMIINHLKKVYVTKDTMTIINNLEIIHPAVKLLKMVAVSIHREIADGTNFVVTVTGAMLGLAES